MRHFYLFISFFCILVILALTGCGSEEEITPPVFSKIKVNGTLVTSESLAIPFSDPVVTITGNIDDLAATLVASTVSGEVPVSVSSVDGSWIFPLPMKEGANPVSFTASDQRGNINQLVLTVTHDTTPPQVKSVKQSVDPAQLLVTFKESLLATSLPTAPFSVLNALDDTVVVDSLVATVATSSSVTLSLAAVLPQGAYRLACPGVKDIAAPDGNSVAVDYFFAFTIQ